METDRAAGRWPWGKALTAPSVFTGGQIEIRNKRRVPLTQVTLTLSGVIFMMVMGARETAIYTFDELVPEILCFNVNFQLKDPERIDRVEGLTLRYPGVENVEVWAMDEATIRPARQQASRGDALAFVIGVPASTSLYGTQMRAGRWLLPGDGYAVVLSQQLATDAGVSVGDMVTLKHGVKGESDWMVIGLLFDPVFTNWAHVPRAAMLKEIHSSTRASTVWIRTVRQDAAGEADMARQLREYYRKNRLGLSAGGVFGNETASDVIGTVLGQFAIIVTLLATMTVVIGVVGSIALSGTVSLNVLDRRHEFGVLKAIGASSGVVSRLFVGGGMLLGWLSWAIALPLSVLAGQLMVQGLSEALGMELVYRYTPLGAVTWLVIITVLSVVASWFPARSAACITVREALAHE